MSNEYFFEEGTAFLIFLFLVILLITVLTTISITNGMWETSAIQANIGRYNDKTAQFEWIVIKPELEKNKNDN